MTQTNEIKVTLRWTYRGGGAAHKVFQLFLIFPPENTTKLPPHSLKPKIEESWNQGLDEPFSPRLSNFFYKYSNITSKKSNELVVVEPSGKELRWFTTPREVIEIANSL